MQNVLYTVVSTCTRVDKSALDLAVHHAYSCVEVILATMAADAELNPNFYCPITTELMRDPVIDSDGNTFERSAIERAWTCTLVFCAASLWF